MAVMAFAKSKVSSILLSQYVSHAGQAGPLIGPNAQNMPLYRPWCAVERSIRTVLAPKHHGPARNKIKERSKYRHVQSAAQ